MGSLGIGSRWVWSSNPTHQSVDKHAERQLCPRRPEHRAPSTVIVPGFSPSAAAAPPRCRAPHSSRVRESVVCRRALLSVRLTVARLPGRTAKCRACGCFFSFTFVQHAGPDRSLVGRGKRPSAGGGWGWTSRDYRGRGRERTSRTLRCADNTCRIDFARGSFIIRGSRDLREMSSDAMCLRVRSDRHAAVLAWLPRELRSALGTNQLETPARSCFASHALIDVRSQDRKAHRVHVHGR